MSEPSQETQTSTRPVMLIHRLMQVTDVADLCAGDVIQADCSQSRTVVNTDHIDYNGYLPEDDKPTKQVTCGASPHIYGGPKGDKYVMVCQNCKSEYAYTHKFLSDTLEKHNSHDQPPLEL